MAKRSDDGKRKAKRRPRKATTPRRARSSRAAKPAPRKSVPPVRGPAKAARTSELVDGDLAQRAIEKQRKGETPTAQELAALRRVERQRDEALREEHYASIPQRDWIRMSGRQRKVIVDQAQKYGLPIGGATINLADLAKGLHDFLAANAPKLAADDGGNGSIKDQQAKVDLDTKSLRNERQRMELEKDRGLLISRRQAHDDRLKIVKVFVGVVEIAGSELSSLLAGRKPAEVRKLVEQYFDGKRRDIADAADRQA